MRVDTRLSAKWTSLSAEAARPQNVDDHAWSWGMSDVR